MAGTGVDSRLAVLLFTDIVGSVDLKSRLGTSAYARLLSRHNEIFHATTALGDRQPLPSRDTGVPPVQIARRDTAVPAVLTPEQPTRDTAVPAVPSPESPHLVGLAIDFASRIMSLATGGQILLTRPVFD